MVMRTDEPTQARAASRFGAFRRFLGFVGPGFLVSVGYMDPGNWATDLAGGSQFGYALLWVILLSNLMAILFQLGGHPEELAHGRRITLPAGLREIEAGRNVEADAQMLEQNRHQVR